MLRYSSSAELVPWTRRSACQLVFLAVRSSVYHVKTDFGAVGHPFRGKTANRNGDKATNQTVPIAKLGLGRVP